MVWDDEKEKYYFSVVDVVGVLTESVDYQLARNYWKVLKHRLIKEGLEPVTICNQLKLVANDGKRRETDVADLEGILRIIQSIPSRKAEPISSIVWGIPSSVATRPSIISNPKTNCRLGRMIRVRC